MSTTEIKNYNTRKTISNEMLNQCEIRIMRDPDLMSYSLQMALRFMDCGWIHAQNSNVIYVWSHNPRMAEII